MDPETAPGPDALEHGTLRERLTNMIAYRAACTMRGHSPLMAAANSTQALSSRLELATGPGTATVP
jgi:hypothetical protein